MVQYNALNNIHEQGGVRAKSETCSLFVPQKEVATDRAPTNCCAGSSCDSGTKERGDVSAVSVRSSCWSHDPRKAVFTPGERLPVPDCPLASPLPPLGGQGSARAHQVASDWPVPFLFSECPASRLSSHPSTPFSSTSPMITKACPIAWVMGVSTPGLWPSLDRSFKSKSCLASQGQDSGFSSAPCRQAGLCHHSCCPTRAAHSLCGPSLSGLFLPVAQQVPFLGELPPTL